MYLAKFMPPQRVLKWLGKKSEHLLAMKISNISNQSRFDDGVCILVTALPFRELPDLCTTLFWYNLTIPGILYFRFYFGDFHFVSLLFCGKVFECVVSTCKSQSCVNHCNKQSNMLKYFHKFYQVSIRQSSVTCRCNLNFLVFQSRIVTPKQ